MFLNLSKILNDLNTFVVPQHCFGCNDVLYRGEHVLCAFCRNELPLTEFNFRDENAVDRIFYGRCKVFKAGALLYYSENGIVQRLIHGLKYRGLEKTGTFLGAWYGAELSREPILQGVDFILPVPLHKNKARKRGYNQCTRFGQEIALRLGATYSEKLLVKTITSPTQTTKDRWNRWRGIHGAFHTPTPGKLKGKSVLLVDDVITTGATLEACCTVLQAAGCRQLFIGAMAFVP